MPLYYQNSPRGQRGYATFRDAAEDLKRKQTMHLAQQEYPSVEQSVSDDYYDEFGDPGFDHEDVNSPEWLSQHAMPSSRESDEPIPFEQPPMMTPEQAAEMMREHDPGFGQPLQTPDIPPSYFQPNPPTQLDRAGKYLNESVDAFGRAAANTFTLNQADNLSARLGAITGVGGVRGDYLGNLKRQEIQSELAKIQSPEATKKGQEFAYKALLTPPAKYFFGKMRRWLDPQPAPGRTPYIRTSPRKIYRDY